jgi:hypothetical protein
MTFPGSMGVSDATSAANIQTYIDLLIANGGTGCLHVHLLTSTQVPVLQTAFAYLRTKELAGQIDIETPKQWLDGKTTTGRIAASRA